MTTDTTESAPLSSGDDVTVDVWWRADCGYLHLERNPVVLDMRCGFRLAEPETRA